MPGSGGFNAFIYAPPAFLTTVRKTKVIQLDYSATAIVPHVFTQRLLYTVPAGRIFTIYNYQTICARETVATTPKLVQSEWQLTPNGVGVGVPNSIGVSMFIDNSITGASRDKISQSQLITIYYTDTLTARTKDLSTGGTCAFYQQLTGTEFDIP